MGARKYVNCVLICTSALDYFLPKKLVIPRLNFRAGEIALVGDFQNSQTRVLHVVRAQAAIVGAAPVHLGVEPQRHSGGLM